MVEENCITKASQFVFFMTHHKDTHIKEHDMGVNLKGRDLKT
jgi:hypothetical protein